MKNNKDKQQRYSEFSIENLRQYEEDLFIEQSIKDALKNDDFYLVFMPFYNSKMNQIAGAEALLRCSSPSLSDYSPEVYVRVAEQRGLIKEIDLWVIERAFATLQQHQDALDEYISLSINISSRQMLDHLFVSELKQLKEKYNINPIQICLELTETFFVDINDPQITNIEDIRKLGFSVALDDFGTGYTSFAYLTHIPADEIKIDRSYVNQLNDRSMSVIVSSIINIAKEYNYRLVAEGVETQEQLNTLITMGCDTFQGYHISKPTSFEQLLQIKANAKYATIHTQ